MGFVDANSPGAAYGSVQPSSGQPDYEEIARAFSPEIVGQAISQAVAGGMGLFPKSILSDPAMTQILRDAGLLDGETFPSEQEIDPENSTSTPANEGETPVEATCPEASPPSGLTKPSETVAPGGDLSEPSSPVFVPPRTTRSVAMIRSGEPVEQLGSPYRDSK